MTSHIGGKGILLKADPIASAFRDEIKASLNESRPPKLVGILATSAAPSKFYAEFTKKQCEDLGVNFVLKKIGAAEDPSKSEGEGVEEAIIEANNDDTVDGIMVGTFILRTRAVVANVPTHLVCLSQRFITLSSECSRLVTNPTLPLRSLQLNCYTA